MKKKFIKIVKYDFTLKQWNTFIIPLSLVGLMLIIVVLLMNLKIQLYDKISINGTIFGAGIVVVCILIYITGINREAYWIEK